MYVGNSGWNLKNIELLRPLDADLIYFLVVISWNNLSNCCEHYVEIASYTYNRCVSNLWFKSVIQT